MRHVIFDLDGTLTDPSLGIVRSFEHAQQRLGRTRTRAPETELRRFIGPPLRDAVAELLDTRDPVLIEQAVALYRERYGTLGLLENEVYPGIVEVLEQLLQRGHSLWICTGKPGAYAARIAEHFGLTRWLRGIYGCELDGTRADKAELLAYLMEREGILPNDAVMVGDRMHDVQAAKACGMPCIGVLYGFGTELELSSAGAASLCGSVSELTASILALVRAL